MKHLKTFIIATILIFNIFFISNVKAFDIPNNDLTFTRFTGTYEDLLNGMYKDDLFLFYNEYKYNGFFSSKTVYLYGTYNTLANTDLKLDNDFITLNPSNYLNTVLTLENIDNKLYFKFLDDNYVVRYKNYAAYNTTKILNSDTIYLSNIIKNDDDTYYLKDKDNEFIIGYQSGSYYRWAPQGDHKEKIKIYHASSNNIHTINLHLNGGTIENDRDKWVETTDFSISLYDDEIEDFFTNLNFKKKSMIFDGWYYDQDFKNVFTPFDKLQEDNYNLYAKWRYEKVDDFLNDYQFNSYNYDINYSFAVINRGDKTKNVYIGLPFSTSELEIYEYDEKKRIVEDGASVCPVPLFVKDGFYYYDLNTLSTNNQEILLLPRSIFEKYSAESFEFKLSVGAYISYTNDLTEATIVDSNGNSVNINIKNSYDLSQEAKEYYSHDNIFSRIKLFISKFKKNILIIKEPFEYLFFSLNESIRNFIIYLFILILVVGTLNIIKRG